MEKITYQNTNYTKAENTTIKVNGAEKDSKTQVDSKKTETNVIDASEINLVGKQDSKLKNLFAKKAAWEVQMEQFEKDSMINDSINEHGKNRENYLNEAYTNNTEVNRLMGLKADLKETYAVEDDSQEQQDLELLEKKFDNKNTFTQEEKDRLANMGPLTDYQKAAMEYKAMAKVFKDRADSAAEGAKNENKTITAIQLESLKVHPMVDAKKDAEEMLNQVNEEIQKSLLDEIKNRVDENLNVDPNKSILDDPQALINQKKATEEDLKGLAVDEKV